MINLKYQLQIFLSSRNSGFSPSGGMKRFTHREVCKDHKDLMYSSFYPDYLDQLTLENCKKSHSFILFKYISCEECLLNCRESSWIFMKFLKSSKSCYPVSFFSSITGSIHQQAAIDLQRFTGNVAGVIGCHKEYRPGDLFRCSFPAQRNSLLHSLPHLIAGKPVMKGG